jgi:hypothetical protein
MWGQSVDQPVYLNPALPAQQRATDLVHRMTLEEKASQLVNGARAISGRRRRGNPPRRTNSAIISGLDAYLYPSLSAGFDTRQKNATLRTWGAVPVFHLDDADAKTEAETIEAFAALGL